MRVTVRRATVADADALGVVHVQAWRETYAHLLSAELLASVSAVERADRWRTIIRNDLDHRQFVAEVDGEVVGFAASGPARDVVPPREFELYAIYLLAAHHGGGAGQKLLDAAIGKRPAYLWVAADNPRAQAFYRRNGFRVDGTRKIEQLRGEPLPEVRMTR